MSHQAITAGAHMDGVYHDSHALEGGNEVVNGILYAWWPDTYNDKLLVQTREDIQLWDMNGGGFDRTVMSGSLPHAGQVVTANTDNERFIVRSGEAGYSSFIYDYDGNLLYTNTPSGSITNGTYIHKLPYARSDNKAHWTRTVITQIAPIFYNGQYRDAFNRTITYYSLDDDNNTSLIFESTNVTYHMWNNGFITKSGHTGPGITFDIGSYYYYVTGVFTWTNYVKTQKIVVADQDGQIIVDDLRYAYGNNGLLYADHYLAKQNSELRKIEYNKLWADGKTTSTNIGGGFFNPHAGSNHEQLMCANTGSTSLLLVSGEGQVTDLGVSVPLLSNAGSLSKYFAHGGYFYYDHKDAGTGNDLISRINLSTSVIENLVELTP